MLIGPRLLVSLCACREQFLPFLTNLAFFLYKIDCMQQNLTNDHYIFKNTYMNVYKLNRIHTTNCKLLSAKKYRGYND